MGSYNPVLNDTFDKLELKYKALGTRPKSNYLGTAVRFPSDKKLRATGPPGPGHYPMIPKWPGENERNLILNLTGRFMFLGKEEGMKKDNKTKNWMENISKGTSEVRSIYYWLRNTDSRTRDYVFCIFPYQLYQNILC